MYFQNLGADTSCSLYLLSLSFYRVPVSYLVSMRFNRSTMYKASAASGAVVLGSVLFMNRQRVIHSSKHAVSKIASRRRKTSELPLIMGEGI
ncbi:hypothetical protein P9112_005309 [Eukaryota sp. TZLM1-RC]